MGNAFRLWLTLRRGYRARRRHAGAEAERLAHAALELAPECAAAWRLLGLEYSGRADTVPPDEELEAQAVDFYRKAHSCDPRDRLIATNLVCYLGFLGRVDEALEIAGEFAALNPKHAAELREIAEQYRSGSTRGMKKEDIPCF